MGGRHAPDWVAAMLRNYWPSCSGLCNNARKLKQALLKRRKDDKSGELISWWKEQKTEWITALQSFMFWLCTQKQIEYSLFEQVYNSLTPIQSSEKSIPIEISNGMDNPIFHDGFIEHPFSVFNYKFSPSNKGLVVTYDKNQISEEGKIGILDQFLDFFSFLLSSNGYYCTGFRKLLSRTFTNSSTSLIVSGLGPESRRLPDFDFLQIEEMLSSIGNDDGEKISIWELLRIRHRAVLDSTLESKMLTLWSAFETLWGEENQNDRLFSESEKYEIKKALNFLSPEKNKKVLESINKIKTKTKNDYLISEISKFKCMLNINTSKTVREMFYYRSKFAHGGAIAEDEQDRVTYLVSLMFKILEELITNRFLSYHIVFRSSK